jgi:hypothetical protein
VVEADERTEASGADDLSRPASRCSGRLAVVEAQEPADALAANDRSGSRGIGWRLEEPPIEALVVALGVVAGNVFSDGCAEMVLAQQHELAEALAFDGPHEAFGVRV